MRIIHSTPILDECNRYPPFDDLYRLAILRYVRFSRINMRISKLICKLEKASNAN